MTLPATLDSMDFHEQYRAVSARDKRFDGMFVMGVRSTGIYCRSSCPARTPKASNVEFFPTSAAAHRQGYRACKRCLPEAVPQNPIWRRRDDISARAMRLIEAGYVDQHGVGGLASHLGVSERQLQRLLLDELGATPLGLAQAQRAQNARQLLLHTDLPIAEVAFASGFHSIRQFNDVIKNIFSITPRQFRQSRTAVTTQRTSHSESGSANVGLNLNVGVNHPQSIWVRLQARQPFDASHLMSWFSLRGIPGLEHGSSDTYSRTLLIEDRVVGVGVTPVVDGLKVQVTLEQILDLPRVLHLVRHLFDLDADTVGMGEVLSESPIFQPLVAERPGLRVPGAVGLTEIIVRAILGQQVTVEQARQNVARLVEALGDPTPWSQNTNLGGDDIQHLTRVFPTPAQVAEAPDDLFKGPRKRRDNLRNICSLIANEQLVLDIATPLEEFNSQLLSLPGIGPWTADYVAFRYLGHPDVFVRGDAGVIRGAKNLGFSGTHRELESWVESFAPWRSYVTMHLWEATGDTPLKWNNTGQSVTAQLKD